MLGDELRLLLEPTTLLVGVELGGGPDRTVLGRRAGTIVLRPRPWRPFADPHLDTFSLGAEEVELWVDRARGLPLRVQARRGGQVLRTLAVGDLTLDVEHDPETFTLRPPDDAPFALAEEFMPHWTPRGRRVRQERTAGAGPEAG